MQISFTNCEKEDYKVQQVGELQKAIKVGFKVRWVSNYKVQKKRFQSAKEITKSDEVDYKVQQVLENQTRSQSVMVQPFHEH